MGLKAAMYGQGLRKKDVDAKCGAKGLSCAEGLRASHTVEPAKFPNSGGDRQKENGQFLCGRSE